MDISVEDFNNLGYLVLKDVMKREECEIWKKNIDNIINSNKSEASLLVNDKGKTVADSGIAVWFSESCPPFVLPILTEGIIPNILKKLYSTEKIEFLSCKPVIKTGKVKYASPWHQDYSYWEGSTKISCWISLDDASIDNGCLRVIPKSHKEYLIHEKFDEKIGFDNRLSEEQVNTFKETILDVVLKPGDVLIFHDLLLHSSNPNTNGKDRYCLIPSYRNYEVKDESSVWKNSILC